MNIPRCPNFLEGKCERSDTRYAGETKDKTADAIICHTCKLFWLISKPKVVGQAKYENHIERMKKATEADRRQASKKAFVDLGRKF